jgi:hypothetical protein
LTERIDGKVPLPVGGSADDCPVVVIFDEMAAKASQHGATRKS